VIVKTAEPDFDRAMDWVAKGVFSAVASPVDAKRLRAIAGRALESLSLFETVADNAKAGRQGGDVYKRLAGHMETGPTLQALCDTARKLSGAARAEAVAGIDGGHQLTAHSGDPASRAGAGLSMPLNWMGRDLGCLRLGFGSPMEAGRVDRKLLDELSQAGSLFLGQAVRYEEAVKMASRDPLTGLHNRRIFLETLEREFTQAKRHNSPLSLLTIDLDHFKAINDTYGHQSGDEVLKWLSMVLTGLIRSCDLPARVGGEEFAVILPRTNLDRATTLAHRLKEALSETPLPAGAPDLIRPTISQGLASLEHFLVNSTQDLIYWSDQAMYLAKREGRNAIRAVSDLPGKTSFQDVQHVFQ
jgi:diguanylate cyclase (GGDEF)-like protein